MQSMRGARILSFIILVPFTALTLYALYDVGFVGLLKYQAAQSGGIQVFADLSIALLFFVLWMVPHARHTGRNPWPYIVMTLVLGSYGPLLYFALASSDDPLRVGSAQQPAHAPNSNPYD